MCRVARYHSRLYNVQPVTFEVMWYIESSLTAFISKDDKIGTNVFF